HYRCYSKLNEARGRILEHVFASLDIERITYRSRIDELERLETITSQLSDQPPKAEQSSNYQSDAELRRTFLKHGPKYQISACEDRDLYYRLSATCQRSNCHYKCDDDRPS